VERQCTKCDEVKERDGFPAKGGRICRACKVAVAVEWKRANPERAKVAQTAAVRRRRADPERRQAELDRDAARRRAANPRMGREFTVVCERCQEPFTYVYQHKPRRVCTLCRAHDSDWKKFGLSGPAAELMRGNAVCAICKTTEPGGRYRNWHIDHDHATGAVRDVLCQPCNSAIGLFRDDPALLERAALYLRTHARQDVPQGLDGPA
jgi:hypothetical protein